MSAITLPATLPANPVSRVRAWPRLGRLLPWLVLIFFLAITYRLWKTENQYAIQTLKTDFDARVLDVDSHVKQRMLAYMQELRGVQGLFAASHGVEREEFRAFINALRIDETYPGIQSVGFAPIVLAAEKDRHIAAIRKGGFPEYTVRPEGVRAVTAPVIYIEPFSGRNLRAFGHDTYFQPIHRAAQKRARDFDQPVITGKLQLVQESEGRIQAGFVMYLPIYKSGAPHDTLDGRRANILGWLSASFRMDDLMSGILGGHSAGIDIEIYDGEEISGQRLMYDHDNHRRSGGPDALFQTVGRIEFADHAWTILTRSLPAFEAGLNKAQARFIAVAGIVVSVLLALLTWLLMHGRARALKAAREMNLELIESEQGAHAAYEMLRDAEERWRFALEGAGDGVWDWNVQMDKVRYSKRWKEMLGFAEDEIGTSLDEWRKRVHPEDISRAMADIRAYFDGKTASYLCHLRMMCKDGSWKWILARGMVINRAESGQPLRMIGTHTDITVHKQTEEKMQRAREDAEQALAELSSYIQAIDQHAIVSVTDIGGNIVQINDKFCEISGYGREELLGQNHRIINSGAHARAFFAEFWRTIARGDIWHGEICNRAKDGSLYWVDSAIVPLKDARGKIIRYISVRLDITRRKESETKLLNAMKAAEAASRAKSEFLSNMSHEIRTPMNSIIGMTHLALRTALDPKQRDYVAKIDNSAQHLLRLINDILDFSKIEAGKLVMEEMDFELEEVFSTISSQLSYSAAKKDLPLVFDVGPDLSSPLRGDPLRLTQVLINYVGNAIKFTHAGKITVRARILEAGDTDSLVRFEVQDTGIGISAAEVTHLFQLFNQVDTSITRVYGGTGLGLAICRQLAEMMGGEVGVESQPGLGSTFWFTARFGRCVKTAAAEVQGLPPAELGSIKDASILLVEDNLFNQQIARELLGQAGATVCIANNGREALEMLEQKHFACVLMDIQMPVMDGLEATRRIRANPALAATRVIAMTANAGHEDRERCLKAGMDDFITKPVFPGHLYDVLAKWLVADVSDGRDSAVKLVAGAGLATGAGDPGVIDLSVLEKMVGSDPVKVRKFALKFLKSARDGLDRIEAALEHGDMAALAALGHRIKSPARTVGAVDFADLCQALERCAGAGDAGQAHGLIGKMQSLLAKIEKQMDKAEITLG